MSVSPQQTEPTINHDKNYYIEIAKKDIATATAIQNQELIARKCEKIKSQRPQHTGQAPEKVANECELVAISGLVSKPIEQSQSELSLEKIRNIKKGIHPDLDIDLYHNSEGISSTGISLILDCPKRFYFERFIKPTLLDSKEENKLQEKYKIGRAVHMLVLEPDKFNTTFYCMDEPVNLVTKAGKEVYAAAEIKANGRDIIRFEEWKNIKEMAAAISSHAVWNILKGGKVEHSIYWKDGSYNTLLKARPDIFTDDLIVDVKTTESIKAFPRVLYSYGYHRQAAMQVDALFKTDNKKRYFAFFVVEKKAPYLTICYTLDEESIELGRKEYLEGAKLYSQCLAANKWPGYDEQFQLIKLPNYLNKNEEIYND